MLFNSLHFAIFLPIVFAIYWLLSKHSFRIQNVLLLVASYYFYACWDWRFLFLLMFSTFLDYFTGLQIEKTDKVKKRKFWFWLSIIVNLGFLSVFKYFNFFVSSFADLFEQFGLHINTWTLNIILPVGISFYTFHGLSYVIDIYKKRIKAESNFIDYGVFVSFFPLLVAGPIERATHLLPQLQRERTFNYSQLTGGLRQILWGLFKKIVIADNCAVIADHIFNNSGDFGGSTLFIGAVLFAFQIYGDFSGYTDIALGTARLFGIELLRNFNFPYFSRDIAEFWRRWHISLSTWFRDYLYIPLGGSKGGTWSKIRNTFIIFLVSGFWHGANWTFIVWGLINAIYFLPLLLVKQNRQNMNTIAEGRLLPSFREFRQMSLTFILTVFAWIFFRSESVGHSFSIFSEIFSISFFEVPKIEMMGELVLIFILIGFFMVIEWLGRHDNYAIEKTGMSWTRVIRYSFYSLMLFCILSFMQSNETPFIYFQF